MTPGAPQPITRLAPSPTGALHLGNARTFLINWAMARRRGWRIILRIEDLDTPRVRAGETDRTIDILRWLGIDWDDGPHVQSSDLEPYRHAMRTLAARGCVFPCSLSRTEIDAAASAPNEGDHETRFDPALRPRNATPGAPAPFDDEATNWRLFVDDRAVRFHDRLLGPVERRPGASVGDFIVWTRRAQPSYQLAVVVDDARSGVTEIVRGDDLLDSAARQLLLYEALGLAPTPACTHLPLVRGPDGRRLAKRHGDTRLASYREAGVAPERIVGLIAAWSGAIGHPSPLSAVAFAESFELDRLPRHDVTFTAEDDRWLRG